MLHLSSYCDHSIFVVCPSVHHPETVHIFNFSKIAEGISIKLRGKNSRPSLKFAHFQTTPPRVDTGQGHKGPSKNTTIAVIYLLKKI